MVFFHVSCKRSCQATSADKLAEDIQWAMGEIRRMLESEERDRKAAVTREE